MSDYSKISKFLEKYDRDNGVHDYDSLCDFLMQQNSKFPKTLVLEYDKYHHEKGALRDALERDYAKFKRDYLS